jgi:hypothetical protein
MRWERGCGAWDFLLAIGGVLILVGACDEGLVGRPGWPPMSTLGHKPHKVNRKSDLSVNLVNTGD